MVPTICSGCSALSAARKRAPGDALFAISVSLKQLLKSLTAKDAKDAKEIQSKTNLDQCRWSNFGSLCVLRVLRGSIFCKECRLRGIGDRHARDLRLLQQLPEIAVGRAVVQLAFVLNRTPVDLLRGEQDVRGVFDFGMIGFHRIDDRLDLCRINAPH